MSARRSHLRTLQEIDKRVECHFSKSNNNVSTAPGCNSDNNAVGHLQKSDSTVCSVKALNDLEVTYNLPVLDDNLDEDDFQDYTVEKSHEGSLNSDNDDYVSNNDWWNSSDDEETAQESEAELLQKELAQWATEGNIPLTSVTKLLHILHKHGMKVPKQASTLLQTPRNIAVHKMSGKVFHDCADLPFSLHCDIPIATLICAI